MKYVAVNVLEDEVIYLEEFPKDLHEELKDTTLYSNTEEDGYDVHLYTSERIYVFSRLDGGDIEGEENLEAIRNIIRGHKEEDIIIF